MWHSSDTRHFVGSHRPSVLTGSSSPDPPPPPLLSRSLTQHLGSDILPMAQALAPFLPTALLPHRPQRTIQDGAPETSVLAAGPTPGPFPAIPRASGPTIAEALHCSTAAMASLTSLSLAGSRVARVQALSPLHGLQVLCLAFNSLSKVEGLEGLPELRALDLSFNRIQRVEGLKVGHRACGGAAGVACAAQGVRRVL